MLTLTRITTRISLLVAAAMVLIPVVAMAGRGFYTVDASVRAGMLVSLTKNPDVVEPASDKNMDALVGVVGNSVTDIDIKTGQVSIQSDGVVDALVSTLGGEINVGDRISPSTIVGFGAKSDGTSWVVGTAQASLSTSSDNAIKTTVTDVAGKKHDVYVATIPVLVRVMQENAAAQSSAQQSSKLPNKIQELADSVAGKRASQTAVVLSALILLSGLTVTGIITYAAVKNGITSTARQPLAKQAITQRMTQSIVIAMVILLTAVIGSMIIIRIL